MTTAHYGRFRAADDATRRSLTTAAASVTGSRLPRTAEDIDRTSTGDRSLRGAAETAVPGRSG